MTRRSSWTRRQPEDGNEETTAVFETQYELRQCRQQEGTELPKHHGGMIGAEREGCRNIWQGLEVEKPDLWDELKSRGAQRAKKAERTAMNYEDWRSDTITQAAAAWVLSFERLKPQPDEVLTIPKSCVSSLASTPGAAGGSHSTRIVLCGVPPQVAMHAAFPILQPARPDGRNDLLLRQAELLPSGLVTERGSLL